MNQFAGFLAAENDPEGARIPESLPSVIDAHVHLFPQELFAAIWAWFDQFAWPIRYKLTSQQVIEFLLSRGIERVVGLHYAHKPGIARQLNLHMASLCKSCPQLIGTATVFPGEKEARQVLESAFQSGLAAVKLHAHVQSFSLDSPEMHEIYETCSEHRKPLIMHVGREPKSPSFGYRVDPYLICGAQKVEPVLKAYPGLKILVPHLGADEYAAFGKLMEDYDNLWLDIAMVMADYLPDTNPPKLSEMRLDRVLYGTDFPHLPYAWDRELKRLCDLKLNDADLAMILGDNALTLFSDSPI